MPQPQSSTIKYRAVAAETPLLCRRGVSTSATQQCTVWCLSDHIQQPEAYVGMGMQDLVSCSQWGAARFRQSEVQDCGLHVVVPARTSHAVVLKPVKGLYIGHIELTDDVEKLLLLADSMQVFATPLAASGLLYAEKLPQSRRTY